MATPINLEVLRQAKEGLADPGLVPRDEAMAKRVAQANAFLQSNRKAQQPMPLPQPETIDEQAKAFGEVRNPDPAEDPITGRSIGGLIGGVGGAALGGPALGVLGAGVLGGLGRNYDANAAGRGMASPRETFDAGVTEAFMEWSGQKLAGVVGRIGTKMISDPVAGSAEAVSNLRTWAIALREDLLATGKFDEATIDQLIKTPLTPAQISQSKLIDTVEEVVGGFATGKNRRKLEEAQEELLRMLPNYMREGARVLGPDEAARLAFNGLKKLGDAKALKISSIYDEIGRRVGDNHIVNTQGWMGSIQDTVNNFRELGLLDPEKQGRLVGFVTGTNPRISFGAARAARTDLLALIRQGKDKGDVPYRMLRDAKRLVKAIDESIDTSLHEFDKGHSAYKARYKNLQGREKLGTLLPDNKMRAPGDFDANTRQLYSTANKQYKKLYEKERRALYQGYYAAMEDADAGPQVIAKILKDQNVTAATKFIEALGPNSAEADVVRNYFMGALWERTLKSSTAKSGAAKVPSGRAFLEALNTQTKGSGADLIRAVIPPKTLERNIKVAEAMVRAQEKQKAGGALIASMLQAGALGSLGTIISAPTGSDASNAAIGGVGGMVISVAGMGRILNSERMSNALLYGLRFGWKGKAGFAAFSRLTLGLADGEYVDIPATALIGKGAGKAGDVASYLSGVDRAEYKEFIAKAREMVSRGPSGETLDQEPQSKFGKAVTDDMID